MTNNPYETPPSATPKSAEISAAEQVKKIVWMVFINGFFCLLLSVTFTIAVPEFREMFEEFAIELPLITKLLLSFRDLAVVVIVAILFFAALASTGIYVLLLLHPKLTRWSTVWKWIVLAGWIVLTVAVALAIILPLISIIGDLT